MVADHIMTTMKYWSYKVYRGTTMIHEGYELPSDDIAKTGDIVMQLYKNKEVHWYRRHELMRGGLGWETLKPEELPSDMKLLLLVTS